MKRHLRCFQCSKRFTHKSDIWRGNENWPLCKDCFMNMIEFEFDEPEMFADWIEIDFKKSLPKMRRETKRKECPKCKAIIFYKPEDEISCWSCSWNENDYDDNGNPTV